MFLHHEISIHMDAIYSNHRDSKLWDQICQELQNNNSILRLLYVVIQSRSYNGYVATNSTCLWVHRQGFISLRHNQYTMILFIQASEHSSCGTRFGENCKTTKLSSGLSRLLSEEPLDKDTLSPFPHVLCMHWQGLTSLKHNQYIGIPSIPATEHPRCGTNFS